MKSKFVLLIILTGVLVVTFYFLKNTKRVTKDLIPKVHYHAGFIVFENGKKLDFSDNKYMDIKPCTLNGEEDESNEDEQIEKAHLHDNVGDLIHIEAEGAIWRDLFININFPIDYSKSTAYINGQEIFDFQTLPIKSNESLVLFIGNDSLGDVDKKLLSEAVTTQYIEEQSKKSVTCSD